MSLLWAKAGRDTHAAEDDRTDGHWLVRRGVPRGQPAVVVGRYDSLSGAKMIASVTRYRNNPTKRRRQVRRRNPAPDPKKYAILRKVRGGARAFSVAYLDGVTAGGGPIYRAVKSNLTQAEAAAELARVQSQFPINVEPTPAEMRDVVRRLTRRRAGRRNPRRSDGSSGWGPGTGYFSAGPIKTVAELKRVATTLLAHVHPSSKMAAAANSALRSPDFFMARPAMQEELLDMARRYVKNPRGTHRNPVDLSERAAWAFVRRSAQELRRQFPEAASITGELAKFATQMIAQLKRGVHVNPLLGVIGNPPGWDWGRLRQQDLFTGQIDPIQVRKSLGKAAWLGKAPGYVKAEVQKALARLTHDQFLSQVMGYRAHGTLGQRRFKPGGPKNNPPDGVAGTLAERVYEIRYRHASDHKDYKHSFGPGVRITLLKDGRAVVWHPAKPVWKDFA